MRSHGAPARSAACALRCTIVVVALLGVQTSKIYPQSFSTDFDGRGTGTSISVGRVRPNPSTQGPRTGNSNTGHHNSSSDDGADISQTYEEQAAEAERQAKEEELRRKLEQQRRLNAIQEIQHLLEELQKLERKEPSAVQRMRYTQQVIELEKQFDAERKDYMDRLPSYEDRLKWSLDHIVVPPPPHPRHYHQILVRGTFVSPDEAAAAAQAPLENPFTGVNFDDIFGFGSSGGADLARVSLDFLLGQFNRLSPQTNAHLADLKGATADEVVCHSNGCRIAEIMISNGLLKVNRLRMLGGDNAMFELGNLKNLQQHKQLQEVSVYMIKGDIIPAVGAAWTMMELATKIGHPLVAFESMRDDLTYQAIGLTNRPKFDPSSAFQVHTLSYPVPWRLDDPFDKHRYHNYARILKGWRMTNCVNSDGTISQRCIIY